MNQKLSSNKYKTTKHFQI